MFVGMDVHKNYLQVAVLDEKGKVLNNSRVDNNLIKVSEFFDNLHPGNDTKVVTESSGMWYNVYECQNRCGNSFSDDGVVYLPKCFTGITDALEI